ncbi:hypothetical protein [Ureaplasma ceti]|uniref:Uncharacterized protein n=1 Tax=Ureaplasma ceti TaxID=3119530 RepID=A0ABP9UCN9_9BACT
MANWNYRKKKQESYRNKINEVTWNGWNSLGLPKELSSALSRFLPKIESQLKNHKYRIPVAKNFHHDKNVINLLYNLNTLSEEVQNQKQTISTNLSELNNILDIELPNWLIISPDEYNVGFCVNETYLKDFDVYPLILLIRQNIDFWQHLSYTNINTEDSPEESSSLFKWRLNQQFQGSRVLEQNVSVPKIRENKWVPWLIISLGSIFLISIIIAFIMVFVK